MPDDLSTVRRAEQTGARWTTYLLFACLALDAVAIVSGVSQRSLLVRAMAGAQLVPSEAAASAPPHGPIGTLQLVALAGTGIVWLVWLHRAYGNLTLIGSKRLRFNPSWAIGCWFTPSVPVVGSTGAGADAPGAGRLFARAADQRDRLRAARPRRRSGRGGARHDGRSRNRPPPAAVPTDRRRCVSQPRAESPRSAPMCAP